eukprot:1810742-Rhodomonas_salina.4
MLRDSQFTNTAPATFCTARAWNYSEQRPKRVSLRALQSVLVPPIAAAKPTRKILGRPPMKVDERKRKNGSKARTNDW